MWCSEESEQELVSQELPPVVISLGANIDHEGWLIVDVENVTYCKLCVNKTGNTWQGFSSLSAICHTQSLIICLAVDVPKGLLDAEG